MERIKKLREKALNSECCWPTEFYYLFYKNYTKLNELKEIERYTESFYNALSNLTPNIDEGELIVGKCKPLFDENKLKEWNEIYQPIGQERRWKAGGGQDSHMSIDYDYLLQKGIVGIIEDIKKFQISATEEEKEFYYSCKKCLEAVIELSEKYSALALEMSCQTQNPSTAKELENIAKICKKVPLYPAETFHEAVQSIHFVTHCITFNPLRLCSQQFQLGHPDRYLLPYYQRDIKNGILTKNEAQLLLDCLGIQINNRVPSGLSSGYMVGGRDSNGNIIANELTTMFMQVIEDINLVYPAVGLCYNNDMPEKFLNQACEILSKGHSHPAIFNDDTIVKGLLHYGVPESEAYNYIHSTCVEITPVASSNVWVASPYTNMTELLLSVMNQEYDDFESLLYSIINLLDNRIKHNFENENYQRHVRAENAYNPLLSCFVNDCLKKGKDIENGGAKYNWIMPSFVGMANLVDSLYALKQLVYEEKCLTICEFKKILDSNFEGHEELRLKIINSIPKYGNDNDDIDKLFGVISEHIANECEKYSGKFENSKLIPSVFCWIMHERFGRDTSATPDGRVAGFPLGDGSGPCQGREMNGPTASVLSSTKWEHHRFIGGVAVNMKFSKSSLGKYSIDTIKGIIKTFINRGGFEMQINVVDNDTLKKARLNPEEYKDLIVRIGGYSDYFVRLSPEMQEEVIQRTTHNV